ncbi:MAG: cyclase family protein [Alicyclobacillus sp.]|nr:cyclase family protein [Alicyclobacillus sp.]
MTQRIDEIAEMVNNWGRFGPDDEAGTLNYITEDKRRRAVALVRRGRTFSLAIPFDRYGPQPPRDRRLNPQHIMLTSGTDVAAGTQPGSRNGYGYADDMVIMALQAATHWNALAHMFYNYKMYNDRPCTMVNAEGAAKNSITAAQDKLVTRAVLLDFPRALGYDHLPESFRITAEHIEHTLRVQAVELEPGDVLLFRTGHLARSQSRDGWEEYTYTNAPGPGIDVLPFLHRHQVAAVASDTWAFEVVPSGTSLWLPVHAVGIVYMGLLIGENFYLDEWADDCAEDGVYDALFCAPPIPFSRAVGSPVNPLVIK